VVAVSAVAPAHATAQLIGSGTGHAAAGVALGAYSGATLGLLGSMLPCARTRDGQRCVVSATSAGAAFGVAMGGLIGSQNEPALKARYERAGLGLLGGGLVGLGLSAAVDRHGWLDAAALAWVGGAVAAAPEGALVGSGIGVATGLVAWVVLPGAGPQDLVLFGLAGMAVGSFYDWAQGAADRLPSRFGPSLSIPLG
jgi:hypothetical protein